MTFAEGAYDPDNLEYRSMNLESSGFRVMNFQARLYSKMYDQLAKRFITGYQSLYSETSALNKTALADPIAQANAKLAESAKYTVDTVSVLNSAYEQALSLQNNTTFSSEQNGLVTAAVKQLNEALAGLKAKSTDGDKTNSVKPSTSSDPSGAADASGTKRTAEAAAKKNTEISSTSADTGSDVATVMVAIALLFGTGTTVGVYARRKVSHK